jgi:hypothetical protein
MRAHTASEVLYLVAAVVAPRVAYFWLLPRSGTLSSSEPKSCHTSAGPTVRNLPSCVIDSSWSTKLLSVAMCPAPFGTARHARVIGGGLPGDISLE